MNKCAYKKGVNKLIKIGFWWIFQEAAGLTKVQWLHGADHEHSNGHSCRAALVLLRQSSAELFSWLLHHGIDAIPPVVAQSQKQSLTPDVRIRWHIGGRVRCARFICSGLLIWRRGCLTRNEIDRVQVNVRCRVWLVRVSNGAGRRLRGRRLIGDILTGCRVASCAVYVKRTVVGWRRLIENERLL